MKKKTVLFICTNNAARSQMAEGLMNHLWGDRFHAASAGITPTIVSPYAIEVMKEIGIDISQQRSKSMDEFRRTTFEVVVTVCDRAKEACPFFPQALRTIHKGFEDPAKKEGSTDEILATFRRTRDEIRIWIEETLLNIDTENGISIASP